ncbi:DUF3263 domain-containing protein [Actinotalea sp. M2MS4P-6]|uniref:DUF3263 domain-containing protein n=1 Tax=Actinotalea sp. M2MS4P-6 TaxID=2983762 RepID=UPI0021E3A899|nr:DUF3263 domain-containing protein [Actinotalea sp. M2MS4P-6]MCV2395969.1 DUF3263 domain-containing protein [Actinotalea sp. M2MS4P-6]
MTDTDRAILTIEGQHWRHAGTKEAAIHEQLGLSPTAYYQRLNRLLDDPEAVAASPLVVHRLRRIRVRRRRDG